MKNIKSSSLNKNKNFKWGVARMVVNAEACDNNFYFNDKNITARKFCGNEIVTTFFH